MFTRSAIRPLTIATFRSISNHSARGGIKLQGHGHPGKAPLSLLSEEWVRGPLGVGMLSYLCSEDFCAMRFENSGLNLCIMEDEYYSSGLILGIISALAVMKLIPVIAKWTDGEMNPIPQKIDSGAPELKVLSILPPQKKDTLNKDNANGSEKSN